MDSMAGLIEMNRSYDFGILDSVRKSLPLGSLAFLKHVGVQPLFLLLLSLARSVRDVRRLHNLLPENCQLCRRELLLLDKLFREMYGGSPPRGGKRVSDQVAKLMFGNVAPSAGLAAYYEHLLYVDRSPSINWFGSSPKKKIFISGSRDTRHLSPQHFWTTIAGIQFTIEVKCDLDREMVGIRLGGLWSHSLTPDVVRRLLDIEVLRSADYGGRNMFQRYGNEIEYWLTTELGSLGECIEPIDGDYLNGIVSKNGFCGRLHSRLEGFGLPVESVRNIDFGVPVTKETFDALKPGTHVIVDLDGMLWQVVQGVDATDKGDAVFLSREDTHGCDLVIFRPEHGLIDISGYVIPSLNHVVVRIFETQRVADRWFPPRQ